MVLQKEGRTMAAETKNLPLNNSNKLLACLGHPYQRGNTGTVDGETE